MFCRLPAIHRLLVLLAVFQDENVDGSLVRHVSICFKLLSNGIPDEAWRNVKCV